MNLSRAEIQTRFDEWLIAWNEHNIEGVMDWMHEEVSFENWNGLTVTGKNSLSKVWSAWFRLANFKFILEDFFIDENSQKVLFSWQLIWPSPEKKYAEQNEVRRGVDVMHLKKGLIWKKVTYSKTSLMIDEHLVNLSAL